MTNEDKQLYRVRIGKLKLYLCKYSRFLGALDMCNLTILLESL